MNRDVIETLLMLDAVGEGCTVRALTHRLGLAETVVEAVGRAAAVLEERGLLVSHEHTLRRTERASQALATAYRATGLG